MEQCEQDSVLAIIEMEGFNYAFTSFSSFRGIKDEKFHKLREAYVDAYCALDSYLRNE